MKRIKYVKKLNKNTELNQIFGYNLVNKISVNTYIEYKSKIFYSPFFSYGYIQFEKYIDFKKFDFEFTEYMIRYPQFKFLDKKYAKD